ncbi:MAG TPA: hypothetical protein VGM88_08760 [Kofleriaceae bacterium]|jgi:hypothetical protein
MKRLVLLGLVAACASKPAIPAVRFANAPVASIVDDRRDVPKQPKVREFLPFLNFYHASLVTVSTHYLELPRHTRALGTNALDEAPDSTWFTNRIGARALTAEDVKTGPVTHDPSQHLPWEIQSTKVGGTTIGLIVVDAAKVKYLLKFDAKDSPPEMETGIHVIVNRLMWAFGYYVAEDQIFYLDPKNLSIKPGAKDKDVDGNLVGQLDEARLAEILEGVRKEPDGRIRCLVSRWIEGKTIGGHPESGVRADDPNDRIRHEDRRDLRGLLAIDTWLDSVDVTEGQFVDSYVEDPAIEGRHYVVHYMIDFGKSMGAMGDIDYDWWRGHAWRVSFGEMFKGIFTLGIGGRSWEHRHAPTDIRGVPRLFDVGSMSPDHWHPDLPGYVAFLDADDFDMFWGTKLVAKFTPEQIRGAVEAARFTDPRATEYLVETIVKRQDKLARFWFARVNPLDAFAIDAHGALCFDDLAIGRAYAKPAETRYAIAAFDYDGRAVGEQRVTGASHACAASLPAATTHDGYTVYRVTTERSAFAGTTFVHVATAGGKRRVIGVWRE